MYTIILAAHALDTYNRLKSVLGGKNYFNGGRSFANN